MFARFGAVETYGKERADSRLVWNSRLAKRSGRGSATMSGAWASESRSLENRMRKTSRAIFAGLAIFACMTWVAAANADGRAIDGAHSSLKGRVSKSGFFSAFAHNHAIEAPIAAGEVTESASHSQ